MAEWLGERTQYATRWFESITNLFFYHGMRQSTPRNKTIIIHSKLSYGYVGSNTTAIVLQLGRKDVITIPTVLYSNHLGLPTVGGGAITPELYKEILVGLEKLTIFDEVATILTGFIGSAELVEITADFIEKIKRAHPQINYVCDPVMGDDGSFYVPEAVPQAIIERLLPLADLMTPNFFEVQAILGTPVHTLEELTQHIAQHPFLSHKKLVVTSCTFDHALQEEIINTLVMDDEYEMITAKRIDVHPAGNGELFTAHLQLSLLEGVSFKEAVYRSSYIVKHVLSRMYDEGRKDFSLEDMHYALELARHSYHTQQAG